MQTSTLKFRHGDKTCAWQPGKFCVFVSARHFGMDFRCSLFDAKLFDSDGWLQRCDRCRKMDEHDEVFEGFLLR